MNDKRQSVINEWFPVAAVADLAPGSALPFRLLDGRYLLLGAENGTVSAVPDTCPHRGAQLSLGSFDGRELVCPYHGWRFGSDGRCVQQPAHPGRTPPSANDLAPLALRPEYGLWWVCLGDEPRNLPRYPAFDRYRDQNILCDVRTVSAAGPRLIENFLDLAHLPFVHEGSLGVGDHAEVVDHEITIGAEEIEATGGHFWQPQPGPGGSGGTWVTYSFSVSHPYAARLRKIPRAADGDGGDESADDSASFDILLAVSPEEETRCRVWMLTSAHAVDADLEAYKDFGAEIFDQDVPIVESQRPELLPLEPKAEAHQRADRLSLAYRRWLADRGTTYGTSSGHR